MRKVHFILSTLVLASLVLQFYLAGVGVFSMPEDELFVLHTTNGRFVVSALLLLNVAAAALARGRTLRYALGLVGLLALQTVIFVSFLWELGYRAWGPLLTIPFALVQGWIFRLTRSLTYIVCVHLLFDLVLFLVLVHAHNRQWLPLFVY